LGLLICLREGFVGELGVGGWSQWLKNVVDAKALDVIPHKLMEC